MEKISGVYKITNKITGDCYIGSSRNIKQRWIDHKKPSRWEFHPGVKLYQAFINYGLYNFKFEVIEEATSDLTKREQFWIDRFHPAYNDKRVDGFDYERNAITHKMANKEWNEANRDKYLAIMEDWRNTHKAERQAKNKEYFGRLCTYKGELLTLSALSKRFQKEGVPHPVQEAKKFLV